MTGLGANGEIRPTNSLQKVSIFGPLHLNQKWGSYCKEAKEKYLELLRNMWLCTATVTTTLNRILIMVPILAQILGVHFFGGHISLKNVKFSPFLATIQALSKTCAF
jgi:hypothetical protein